MAFQIVDDILDFDATREEMGKPVGRDLAQGILTLPAIMAIERYPTDNPIVSLCEHRGDESSLRRAVDMIQNSSIIEDSLRVAEQYSHKALDSLGELDPNRSRESLEELVSYVVSRRS
jgi:geranylgeranyl pyrophosphate synthase